MIPHETNRGGFYVICPNVTNKINNGNEGDSTGKTRKYERFLEG